MNLMVWVPPGPQLHRFLRQYTDQITRTGAIFISPWCALYYIEPDHPARAGRPLTAFIYENLTAGYKGRFLNKGYDLLDPSGEIIAYMNSSNEDVPPLRSGGRYYFRKGWSQYVFDADGRPIPQPSEWRDWEMLALILFYTRNEESGIKDTNGRIIVPAAYGNRFSTDSSGFTVWRADTAYAYDPRGRLRFRCHAHGCKQLQWGFVGIQLYGSWGIKDSTGRTTAPFRHRYPDVEHVGSGWIKTGSGAYIDAYGRRTGKDDYLSAVPLPGGFWLVHYPGFSEFEIRNRQMRLVFSSIQYPNFTLIGDRYLALKRAWSASDNPVVYDLRKRAFVDRLIESSPAPGRYLALNERTGRRELYNGDSRLNLPRFTDITPSGQEGGHFILIRDTTYQRPYDDYHDYSRIPTALAESNWYDAPENESALYGVLDSSMRLVVPLAYTNISDISPNLVVALNVTKDRTDFFNGSGRLLTTLYGIGNGACKNGLLLATSNDTTVLIDTAGRLLYKGPDVPVLLYPDNSEDHQPALPALMLHGSPDYSPGLYSLTGRRLLPGYYRLEAQPVTGVHALSSHGKTYFINSRGRQLYGGRGFDPSPFIITEGYLMLRQNKEGRWGAIDAAGATAFPFEFDSAGRVPRIDSRDAQLYFLRDKKRLIVLDNAGSIIGFGDSTLERAQLHARLRHSDRALNWLQPAGRPRGLYNRRGQLLATLRSRLNGEYFGETVILRDTSARTAVVIDSNGKPITPVVSIDSKFAVLPDDIVVLSPDGRSDHHCFRLSAGWRCEPIALTALYREKYFGKKVPTEYTAQDGAVFRTAAGGWGAAFAGSLFRDESADSIVLNEWGVLVKRGSKWELRDYRFKLIAPPTADRIYLIQKPAVIDIDSAGYHGLYHAEAKLLIPPGYSGFYNTASAFQHYVVARRADSFYLVGNGGTLLSPGLDTVSLEGGPLLDMPIVYRGVESMAGVDTDGIVRLYRGDRPPFPKRGIDHLYAPVVIVGEGGRMGLYSNLSGSYLLPPVYEIVRKEGHYFIASRYKTIRSEGIDSTLLLDADGRLIAGMKGNQQPENVYNQVGYLVLHRAGYKTQVISDRGLLLADSGGTAEPLRRDLLLVRGPGGDGIVHVNGTWTVPKAGGNPFKERRPTF